MTILERYVNIWKYNNNVYGKFKRYKAIIKKKKKHMEKQSKLLRTNRNKNHVQKILMSSLRRRYIETLHG